MFSFVDAQRAHDDTGEDHQTTHVQIPKQQIRRQPVRLGDLMDMSKLYSTSRQSSVPAFGSVNLGRGPMRVQKTPQGPRLVRRNIGIGDQNIDPNPFKYYRSELKPKNPVNSLPMRPSRATSHMYRDLNTTGIAPLLSPPMLPVKVDKPPKKNVQMSYKLKEKGKSLRELAIQNSVVKKKQEGLNAVFNTVPTMKQVPIPNSPKITFSAKKPIGNQAIREEILKRNQKVTKTSTVTSQSVNGAGNMDSSTQNTMTLNNGDTISQCDYMRKQTVKENFKAQNMNASLNPQDVANKMKQVALEEELLDNVNKQKHVLAELAIVHENQFRLEAKLQNLKFQHCEKQNEFMALCRALVKLQVSQTTFMIAPVESLPQVDAETKTDREKLQRSLTLSDRKRAIDTVAEKTPLVSAIVNLTSQAPHQHSQEVDAQSDIIASPLIPAEFTMKPETTQSLPGGSQGIADIRGIVTKSEQQYEKTPTDPSDLAKSLLGASKICTSDEILPDSMPVIEMKFVPLAPAVPPMTPDTPQTASRRSQRIADRISDIATNSGKPLKGSVSSASKITRFVSSRKSKSVENIGSPSTGKILQQSFDHNASPSAPNTPKQNRVVTSANTDPLDNSGNNRSLRKSKTFVVENIRKTAVENRRSVVDYRKLQASFPILQTPMKTPVSKSTKKPPQSAMDTPGNISRNVQASLEMLYDSP